MGRIRYYNRNRYINSNLTKSCFYLCFETCLRKIDTFAKDKFVFFKQKQRTMETKTNQNQIVITTSTENEKQKLPVNILLSLAAGAIAGMAVIFGLFWGAEMLLSL